MSPAGARACADPTRRASCPDPPIGTSRACLGARDAEERSLAADRRLPTRQLQEQLLQVVSGLQAGGPDAGAGEDPVDLADAVCRRPDGDPARLGGRRRRSVRAGDAGENTDRPFDVIALDADPHDSTAAQQVLDRTLADETARGD